LAQRRLHALTPLYHLISNLNLTNIGELFKAFRTPLLKSIEPEVAIEAAKRQARIYEVSSCSGRTYQKGKKIELNFQAFSVMPRFWLTDNLHKYLGVRILDAFSVASRFNCWTGYTIRPGVKKRVMEIGAGMGNLARALARGRQRYIAGDIDGEHRSRLQIRLRHYPNVGTRACNFLKSIDFDPLPDSAVCLNVLEHIEDDLADPQLLLRSLPVAALSSYECRAGKRSVANWM
jgi:2-polyprenyl-3-methyl-5-hydroxy-6-metoxy-1,4-benzoquinol methylase